MFLVDEDIWDRALASHLRQSALDCRTIINLIQFKSIEFGSHLVQKLLGSFAIRAPRLAEDSNGVVVNDVLGLSLSSRHRGGIDGSRSKEAA